MLPINRTSFAPLSQTLNSQKTSSRQTPIIDENEFQLFQPRRAEASQPLFQTEAQTEAQIEDTPAFHREGSEETQGLTLQELSNLAGVLSQMLNEADKPAEVLKAARAVQPQEKADFLKSNPPGTYINVRV